MLADLGLFLLSLCNHWFGLLTSGVIAVLLMVIARVPHLKHSFIRWVFLGFLALGLLCSCFLAWKDEHNELGKIRDAYSQLHGDLRAAQASNTEKDKSLRDMQSLLNQKPVTLPAITVQPAPAQAPIVLPAPPPSPTNRASLAIDAIRPDFSSSPLRVTATIRNIGQVPALGLKAAVIGTIVKIPKPDFSKQIMTPFRNAFANGVARELSFTLTDWDAKRIQDIQSGAVPFTIYLHIEYFDEWSNAREPLEVCYIWNLALKEFADCVDQ